MVKSANLSHLHCCFYDSNWSCARVTLNMERCLSVALLISDLGVCRNLFSSVERPDLARRSNYRPLFEKQFPKCHKNRLSGVMITFEVPTKKGHSSYGHLCSIFHVRLKGKWCTCIHNEASFVKLISEPLFMEWTKHKKKKVDFF